MQYYLQQCDNYRALIDQRLSTPDRFGWDTSPWKFLRPVSGTIDETGTIGENTFKDCIEKGLGCKILSFAAGGTGLDIVFELPGSSQPITASCKCSVQNTNGNFQYDGSSPTEYDIHIWGAAFSHDFLIIMFNKNELWQDSNGDWRLRSKLLQLRKSKFAAVGADRRFHNRTEHKTGAGLKTNIGLRQVRREFHSINSFDELLTENIKAVYPNLEC